MVVDWLPSHTIQCLALRRTYAWRTAGMRHHAGVARCCRNKGCKCGKSARDKCGKMQIFAFHVVESLHVVAVSSAGG